MLLCFCGTTSLENSCIYNTVIIKFISDSHIFVYRYVIIPANREKENKEQGMALRGTGGSGNLINLEKHITVLKGHYHG